MLATRYAVHGKTLIKDEKLSSTRYALKELEIHIN